MYKGILSIIGLICFWLTKLFIILIIFPLIFIFGVFYISVYNIVYIWSEPPGDREAIPRNS